MARIVRKNQKVLGGNSSNNGQFGSARAGTIVLDNDPDIIQALPAWESGLTSATVSGENLPVLEESQGVDYVVTRQLAYIFQEGIPEWNAQTEYYQKSIVKKPGTYELYGSLTDGNINNALTDPLSWDLLIDLQSSQLNLTDSHILVGNASNVATDVAMSGDVTIANTGVTAIKTNVALAGNPTTTTQAPGNNTTRIATTAFVAAAVSAITVPVAASQAQQESATATDVFTSPGTQIFHPGNAKSYVYFTTQTTTSILQSYNVSSLTDGGAGITTINFSVTFSSTNFAWAGSAGDSASSNVVVCENNVARTTTALSVIFRTTGNTVQDSRGSVIVFGDL